MHNLHKKKISIQALFRTFVVYIIYCKKLFSDVNFFSNFSQFLYSSIYSCLFKFYVQLYEKNSHCIEFQMIKWFSKFSITFHNFVRFCLIAWEIFYSSHHV